MTSAYSCKGLFRKNLVKRLENVERIRSSSGPCFPEFGLNTVSLDMSLNVGKYGPEKL